MKRPIFTAVALAIGAAAVFTPLAAQALPQAGEPDCLQALRPRGWKVVDNRTLIVTDQLRHNFKVNLAPGCVDLKFSLGLGFRSFSTTRLSCLQRGDSIIVPPDGGLPRQTCLIDSVQAYTAEMSHADAVGQAMDGPH